MVKPIYKEQDKDSKTLFARIISDALIYLPNVIGHSLIQFITVPILTRLITPKEYGNYTLMLVSILLLTIIGTNWIDGSILRYYEIYKKVNSLSSFYTTTFSLLFLSVIVIVTISWVVVSAVKIIKLPFYHFVIGISAFILSASFNVCLVIFRSSQKAKINTLFQLTYSLGSTIIGLSLVKAGTGFPGIFWGWIITVVLLLPLLAWKLSFFEYFHFRNFSWSTAKQFLKYGLPLIISSLSWQLLAISDRYILKYIRGSTEVGIYSVSYTISNQTILIPSSFIMMAAYPIIVAAWEKNGKEVTSQLLSKLIRYHCLLCLPLWIGLSLLSRDILHIFTNIEYVEGYKVFPFVAFGAFTLGLLRYTTQSFILLEKTHIYASLVLLAAFTNIVLNFIIVPSYGFLGAGVTTAFSGMVHFSGELS